MRDRRRPGLELDLELKLSLAGEVLEQLDFCPPPVVWFYQLSERVSPGRNTMLALLKIVAWTIFILGGLLVLGMNPILFAIIPGVILASAVACGLLILLVAPFAILIGWWSERDEETVKVEEEEDPKAERIAQLERRKRTLNKLRTEDKITKDQWLQETKRAQDEIDALV